jgi:hypothetical protein
MGLTSSGGVTVNCKVQARVYRVQRFAGTSFQPGPPDVLGEAPPFVEGDGNVPAFRGRGR